jgi:hypothetical protein
MWRALVEALRIVGVSVLPPKPPTELKDHHAETIAEIATAARSKKFAEWCQKFGLGPSSKDVAEKPAEFRFAISLARRSRPRKRRV